MTGLPQGKTAASIILILIVPAVILIVMCGSNPRVMETPLPQAAPPAEDTPGPAKSGGVVEEIRSLTENGSPPSLLRALDLIRNREAANTEFGRVMIAIIAGLMQRLYPAVAVQFPPLDPPQTHVYARILRDAEKGVYTPPGPNSQDYLEHALPFLALYNETRPERLLPALPDLLKGETLNRESVLVPYFLGLLFERTGRLEEAADRYARAYQLSPECYPASLGRARILEAQGQIQEALTLLADLVIRYPDNLQVKRQLALTYYHGKDWSRAEPAIAEILQRDSRDGEFILMRAHVLVELGQFLQAQTPLDLYASINPNNRLYLFLRARVQAEGYRNRDAALNYLRSFLRISTADDEATVYAARLLIESPRAADQSEGRELLSRLLSPGKPSLPVLSLALQDCIRREAWREARPYLSRLLEERRSAQDLLDAYTVERGQGNNAAALAYAREFYERNPGDSNGAIAYISALIDTGRQDEAARMIENSLSGMAGGVLKSRYYYLRSRIRTSEESVMNELRSSLFEDPRNLSALIAMFEIYHRRRDESRAVFYLKQALALSPDNPQLRRYETEYAGSFR